ncbi:SpoIIE family protein phosphatase [Streptomyces sp.]|uniref:SpoIIE family protein phosphatase n=1 Tax=Streptomyces sp. TaxID=1931 RepID=UPI002F4046E4
MPDFWGDRDRIVRSRERILSGEPALSSLRVPIVNSWHRCQSMGVSPDAALAPPYQPQLDLTGRLPRAAAPVLEQVESQVAGARVGVILADRDGVILRCRAGERALYKHLDAVCLAPGFTYREEYVGTNGIGTTLEERRAFQVFGAEHWVDRLHPFATVGAAVRDPLSGHLEGAIGLVAWCAEYPAMTATLAEAAEAVEQQLLEQYTERERSLLQRFLRAQNGERAAVPDVELDLAAADRGALTENDIILLREKAAELMSTARATVERVPLSRGQLATLVCLPVSGPQGADEGVAVKVSLSTEAAQGRTTATADGTGQSPAQGAPPGPRDGPLPAAGVPVPGGREWEQERHRTAPTAAAAPAQAPREWLLSVGHRDMGRLALAARERLALLYDAGVWIGTALDVTRTAEQLAELVVPRFADFVTVDLLEAVLGGDDPIFADLPLHRAALGSRYTDPPFDPVGARVSFASSAPQARAFADGEAVLEPDLRAVPEWRSQDPDRVGRILRYGIHSLIAVPLRTRGVVLGLASFYRSQESGAFDEDDLHLAEELMARVAICVDNARRFTREQTIALSLQRSLLPGVLPEQTAAEVAHRYLPAEIGMGGAGGDWFDVIPLSGARVALVVGDVVGHGMHAAVTMGRLRTAVHNFAALDLTPDELLGRLDDLVMTIDREESARPGGGDVVGATCLYAVYDPVSQRCAAARAGHPPPAVVRPDGSVYLAELPGGPPLGLGGFPFEAAELHLPEGSQLVLFTDGLIEDRDWDVDFGLEQLRRALAHPDRSPEQTCEAVLRALPGARSSDDVTLLVARTRALGAEHTASWDVPSTPETVRDVRAAAVRQLAEWGLDDCSFTTELLLSELVTNAVRHAHGPIQVRLLRDRALICEVTDGSSTSPHLRHAAATDEGGRGLFLVAQLAQRWGTRYTHEGKVIWTEQPLHPADAAGPLA